MILLFPNYVILWPVYSFPIKMIHIIINLLDNVDTHTLIPLSFFWINVSHKLLWCNCVWRSVCVCVFRKLYFANWLNKFSFSFRKSIFLFHLLTLTLLLTHSHTLNSLPYIYIFIQFTRNSTPATNVHKHVMCEQMQIITIY